MRPRNWIIATGAALAAGLLTASYQLKEKQSAAALLFAEPQLTALPVVPSEMRWGFALDEFDRAEHELRSGDVLGEILQKQGVPSDGIYQLVEHCKGKFKITSMRIGRTLHFLRSKPTGAPQFLVYEPSVYEYAVFHLAPPYQVDIVKRPVETRIVAAAGVLESSFWAAMTDNGLSDELADGMIDVLQYYVDFHHQRQGDRFKVVYEQHFVEGQPAGTGKILAALYERGDKQYYAFQYDKPGERCHYFDFESRPARKAFLKSPLKFSRISSRYDLNRLHPILGYHKAHFGTDYAAPHGTPIMSVANGTVVEATQRGGNGKFVKIRHDGTYESQYLHMSGFAAGIRPGTHVVQGQVIGYVGSTGLATGPHVCFRFWKNGRQVDHLRLDLPSPDPMKGAELEKFKAVRDGLKTMLDGVEYKLHNNVAQGGSNNAGAPSAP
jgi:murein DD-endopeptidase MepM/ murein hydrolase activator NlpD